MGRELRIGIVGYGTGGQAAALLLTRDGHRVEVFERVAQPGPVGAGFLLQPTGLSVLWHLRLLEAAMAHGARITRLYGESAGGRAVMDMRYRELDRRFFGLGMQRGALFSLLDAAWQDGRRIHCGVSIVDVECERGVLRDADGHEHGPFDLVIVADGAASQLRSRVAPPALDRPYPWGAQWCLVEQGRWPWNDELRQRYVGARRMIGMLPVGTRPGDPTARLSFFWSLPAASLDTPVQDAAWRDQVARVWPQAAQALAATDVATGLAQARYRDAVAGSWHRGRAVLLGDAAHAMSPQLGQGVNMALMDALSLARALRRRPLPTGAVDGAVGGASSGGLSGASSHASRGGLTDALADALADYQRERRAHVGIYHFWSRWLTPLFQSDRDRLAAMRDRVFHPMSRLPGGRGQMLRVLTGTRRGWWSTLALEPGFVEALGGHAASAVDGSPAPESGPASD